MEAVQFITFVRACGLEDNVTPVVHYKLADAFFSSDKEKRKILIECVRGLGKSTLMEYLVLYIAVLGYLPGFGKLSFIAFLGDSQDGNVKNFFRNISTKIENSDFLQAHLTVQRKTDKEMELLNKEGVELDIAGKGMNTNIRGIRYKGKRIELRICDDVTTNDAMTSTVIQETINTNYFSSALPALHPTKHKIFYICTPISERDLATKLKGSGAYHIEHHPLCSKFPCKVEEFDSIWADRFPYEYADEMFSQMKASGKAQTFYQEYLLQLTDLSTLLVDSGDIKWYNHADIIANIGNYNIYISSDFSTIGVWAISSNNDWILIDGICARQSMPDNINKVFEFAQKYRPISVGIESSGQQGGFIDIMEDRMIKTNNWFTFAKKPGSKDPGIRPVNDKMHRFVTGVQPKFKQNKVWLPRVDDLKGRGYSGLYDLVEELDNELSKFTSAAGIKALKHDDAIDLLNQLSEMEKFPPNRDVYSENKASSSSNPEEVSLYTSMGYSYSAEPSAWDSYT